MAAAAWPGGLGVAWRNGWPHLWRRRLWRAAGTWRGGVICISSP